MGFCTTKSTQARLRAGFLQINITRVAHDLILIT